MLDAGFNTNIDQTGNLFVRCVFMSFLLQIRGSTSFVYKGIYL